MNNSTSKKELSVKSAILLMTAVSAARGSSFMFSKQLLDTMGPLNLMGTRFLLAFFILMILFGRRVVAAVREDQGVLRAGMVIGFTYVIVMMLELNGLKHTTTATASFIENSAVVLVPLGEAILARKLPGKTTILCSAISLTGIGFIAARGFRGGVGIGEILCTMCALVYTTAVIQTDRQAKRHDALSIGVIYVGVMGTLGTIGSFITEDPHLPQTGTQWAMLLMLAVVCSSFGFAMQPVAQRSISSETTGILTALNPLTTFTLGALILHEPFGITSVIGAVLIITGIILHNTLPN